MVLAIARHIRSESYWKLKSFWKDQHWTFGFGNRNIKAEITWLNGLEAISWGFNGHMAKDENKKLKNFQVKKESLKSILFLAQITVFFICWYFLSVSPFTKGLFNFFPLFFCWSFKLTAAQVHTPTPHLFFSVLLFFFLLFMIIVR